MQAPISTAHAARIDPSLHPGRSGAGCCRLLLFVLLAAAATCVQAADTRVAVGILAHDRGPASDEHENGIDLNGEVQFAPLDGTIGRAIGSPRPHLGASLNFNGDTSAVYGGLTYEFVPHPDWFIDGAIGIALHDGSLHKDPVACAQRSDCGFGYRLLPRLGLEAGFRFSGDQAVSLFWDHMSHGNLLGSENEGIDHLGVRYRLSY